MEISITYRSDNLRTTPTLGSGGDWLYLGGVEWFGYEEKLLTAVNFCQLFGLGFASFASARASPNTDL